MIKIIKDHLAPMRVSTKTMEPHGAQRESSSKAMSSWDDDDTILAGGDMFNQ